MDLFSSNAFFGVSFPVWYLTIVRRAVATLFTVPAESGGKSAVLFTDEDLSKFYIQNSLDGDRRVSPTLLNSEEILTDFLIQCDLQKVSHVTFDPSDTCGTFHPIRKVRSLFSDLS